MADYKDYGYYEAGPTHNLNYQLNDLTRLLNKQENKCILDLGCGNGYLVNHLIELGYNAYGTDASEKGIVIAQKQNADRFFVQDLAAGVLPVQLQAVAFDTIISTEVIEHLYNPQEFIDFCKQQLPNGGQLILTTPYHGYLKNLLLSIMNKWDTHMDPLWIGGHIKLWSKNTLSKILGSSGFTNMEFKGCGRIPYLWKSIIVKAELS